MIRMLMTFANGDMQIVNVPDNTPLGDLAVRYPNVILAEILSYHPSA